MPRALGQIDQRKSEAILDAASEVLSERGLGASVEEIARRAGVSKQTVYNHFGGREEIVRALAERRSSAVTAPLAKPGAAEDPQTALYGYARVLLEAVTSARHAQVMRLTILSAAEHPDLAEIIFSAGTRTSRRRLAEFLAEEDREGRLRIDDPALARSSSPAWRSVRCSCRPCCSSGPSTRRRSSVAPAPAPPPSCGPMRPRTRSRRTASRPAPTARRRSRSACRRRSSRGR
jgi:AcrR family transcriptional regulator